MLDWGRLYYPDEILLTKPLGLNYPNLGIKILKNVSLGSLTNAR